MKRYILALFFIITSTIAQTEISTEIYNLIKQLDSTVPITEQSFAKNKLISMGKDALPYLHKELQENKKTYIRIQIAWILGHIKDPSSIKVLEEVATGPYFNLNKACVMTLAEIGEESLISLERLKSKTTETNLLKIINNAEIKIKSTKTNTLSLSNSSTKKNKRK